MSTVGGTSNDDDMSEPEGRPSQCLAPLRPRHLFDEDAIHASVSLSMRVEHVSHRMTTDGIPWAVIAGMWHRHQLKCVAFPTIWASVDRPKAGEVAVIEGSLARRDGHALILVRDVWRMRLVRL